MIAPALANALVHFLWQGALAALLVAVIRPFCRDARTRYAVASLALLAMLAAFAITFALFLAGPRIDPPSPLAVHAIPASAHTGAVFTATLTLPDWLVPLWLASALLMGLYRVAGWFAAQRLRRTGVCAPPPEWQHRLRILARRVGVTQPLLLLESSLAEVPVVIGLLRPAILLPAGLLTGLPTQHLEAILLHELAHIRRLDYLVNLLQTFVESLLFYHPAVWWISTLMRTERENCCDDVAAALATNPHVYAEALISLEQRRCQDPRPALAATGGNLMQRISRLLKPPEQPRAAAALLLSISLILATGCYVVVGQPPTTYEKWLNQEVVHIMAEPERVAFRALQSDPERDRFIEQFWERRNPNPGSPENKFKIEHYRRLAYVNQHYATKTGDGWTSDRGRAYILYGPTQ